MSEKFLTKELIRKKRDNIALSKEEIDFFISGVVTGEVPNEQISAMAMAIYFNDLSDDERKYLTLSMRNSGDLIEHKELQGKPIVDKHSTGGVSDSISLFLAPLIAVCGGFVPMIAGRGLGHTGGTVDKLESIPNYNTSPSIEVFKEVVNSVGCAIIGQTANLAPADKKIYAVRDTTATVESIPLIASSILSKKLASGIKSLVMDIKVGNGAFMPNLESASALGQTIVNIAKSVGVNCSALITDMNEALGRNIGNSLEIKETIEYLLGIKRDEKLHAVTMALAIEMLTLSSIAVNEKEAETMLNEALNSKKAAYKFRDMVKALGGSEDILTNYNELLPKAKIIKPIYAKKSGFVTNIDSRELGLCLVHLGGGRASATDVLDYSVGLENVVKINEKVDQNNPICIVHALKEEDVTRVTNILNDIITISESPSATEKQIIYKKIT